MQSRIIMMFILAQYGTIDTCIACIYSIKIKAYTHTTKQTKTINDIWRAFLYHASNWEVMMTQEDAVKPQTKKQTKCEYKSYVVLKNHQFHNTNNDWNASIVSTK